MATEGVRAVYQQPCRACGTLIARDSRSCPSCATSSPFVDVCPSCYRQVTRGQRLCAGCGRRLTVTCPVCQATSFVGEQCEACGAVFLFRCPDQRCGAWQFFENERCTACGQKIGAEDRRVVAHPQDE